MAAEVLTFKDGSHRKANMRRTVITDKDDDRITVCAASFSNSGVFAVRVDNPRHIAAVYLNRTESKRLRKALKAAEKTL